MYPIYSEMLARTRSDDVSRTSEPRAERRSSLRACSRHVGHVGRVCAIRPDEVEGRRGDRPPASARHPGLDRVGIWGRAIAHRLSVNDPRPVNGVLGRVPGALERPALELREAVTVPMGVERGQCVARSSSLISAPTRPTTGRTRWITTLQLEDRQPIRRRRIHCLQDRPSQRGVR